MLEANENSLSLACICCFDDIEKEENDWLSQPMMTYSQLEEKFTVPIDPMLRLFYRFVEDLLRHWGLILETITTYLMSDLAENIPSSHKP